MKILAIIITALFLLINTSVAQLRYAYMNPMEISSILINFAMAFCIYMVLINLHRINTNSKRSNQIFRKNGLINKIYRIN